MNILSREFFARDVRLVARELPGQLIVRDDVVVRITECEAYGGVEDSASHCRFGRTARNAPMWGPAGIAYVYLCYGVHHMLNIVTGGVDDGQAILVRAADVVSGHDVVRARRRGSIDLAGPGKVAQALALDTTWTGHDLCAPDGLAIHEGAPASRLLVGPRVGIDFATPRDQRALLRFALAGSDAVTQRASLRAARAPRRRSA